MAYTSYRKDKTGSLQTATNAAKDITIALIESGALVFDAGDPGDVIEAVFLPLDDLTQRIFTPLAAQVDADNATFAEAEKSAPASSGGKKSYSGSKGKSSGGGSVTADEAAETELTWGAFKGETLGDVVKMSKEDVSDNGIDYTGSGKRYVTWLSKNQDNEYMAKRAKLVMASLRGDDEE